MAPLPRSEATPGRASATQPPAGGNHASRGERSRDLAKAALCDTDFTALWWVNGPPHYLTMQGSPPAPVLCLRSGEIGVLLDTKSLRLLHAGRFAKAEGKDAALAAGTAPVLALPTAELRLTVVCAGQTFVCTGRGPEPKDEFFQPVQFVETGRFFQRVAIEGLQFVSADGARLAASGRLELALWPDRLAFALDLEPHAAVRDGELAIAVGRDRRSVLLAQGRQVTLDVFGRTPAAAQATIEADPALDVAYDAALGAYVLRLPETAWSNAQGTYYPAEHLDRLDRWPFRLRNETDREAIARLMFVQAKNLPITGFTPMLCEPDGTPTGLPVQISKNWHQRPDQGHLPHEGPWFHGCAFLRLPARSNHELQFQMAYARYGGVPAASHAQLSLVGWGHNQFWDEAALGSFGESICYEPGRVQRRCFIDDLRPLMTLPIAGGKPWGWAENCGGGDFLVWVDAGGAYHGFRATRTDYLSYGPCLTHVRYREETSGGEIAARLDVALGRSDDYVRAFHRLRYDIKQPVTWQRLAFYQLGADFYNDTPAARVAIGDSGGLREEWTPPHHRGQYDRRSVPLTGAQPWISIHGLERARLGNGSAAASRGLILRSWQARLGGKPGVAPHVSTYGNEWGQGNFKTVIELSPPAGVSTLRPGDFVEAELELVVFPTHPQAYYGPNELFREALAQTPDTWRLVHREAAGNALDVRTQRGKVTRTFPLRVAVDRHDRAAASFDGGIGWVPLTFTGLRHPRGYELRVNGQPFSQSIRGNDYWQTDYDAATERWSQTFNLPRNDAQPLRFEFQPARSTSP